MNKVISSLRYTKAIAPEALRGAFISPYFLFPICLGIAAKSVLDDDLEIDDMISTDLEPYVLPILLTGCLLSGGYAGYSLYTLRCQVLHLLEKCESGYISNVDEEALMTLLSRDDIESYFTDYELKKIALFLTPRLPNFAKLFILNKLHNFKCKKGN